MPDDDRKLDGHDEARKRHIGRPVFVTFILYLILLVAFTQISGVVGDVSGCFNCPAGATYEDNVDNSDAVFIGTVGEVKCFKGTVGATSDYIIEFNVKKIWKGPDTKKIFVHEIIYERSGFCPYRGEFTKFEEGSRYVVFAQRTDNEYLHIFGRKEANGGCNLTHKLFKERSIFTPLLERIFQKGIEDKIDKIVLKTTKGE